MIDSFIRWLSGWLIDSLIFSYFFCNQKLSFSTEKAFTILWFYGLDKMQFDKIKDSEIEKLKFDLHKDIYNQQDATNLLICWQSNDLDP